MKDGLRVKTKLDTPPAKGKILRRERLLSMLNANLDKKLILICADAGYGKTTLLAQFCHELQYPYIFYDLDSQDSETAIFFNYLIAGVRKHFPDFGHRVKNVVSEKRGHEIIVGTFINEFVEKTKDEFYIILDDYHRLQRNRKIAIIINYFLRHLPANLHIVISSRTTPPIYLSYYLAKQELLHLGKEHLQFDLKETRALLSKVYGLDIQEQEIGRIAELSEGWVTVIQLILQKLSVTPGIGVDETLNKYIASGEDVFDYFAQEVFQNQTKTVRDFLVKTSILEYLNPKMCNHILHSRTSEEVISHLEGEHIFVLRSGDNLVYHPLFQEFLCKRLSDSHTDQHIRKLHVTASDYLYKVGDYSAAVNHMVRAGRYAQAVKLLCRHYDWWRDANDYEAFVRLAEMIPEAIMVKYPYLLLGVGSMYCELNKVRQGLKVVDRALRRLRGKNDRRGMAQAYDLKWRASHGLMQSRKALYYVKKAYRLVGKRRSHEKTAIMMHLGTAYRVLGMFSKAQEVIKQALVMARALKDSRLEYDALHMLGMLHYNMSNFKQAEKIMVEIIGKFGDQVYPLDLAYIYRTIGSIAVDSGDMTKALDYIGRAESIVQQYSDRYLSHYLVLLKGRISVYQGEYGKAIEFFNRVIELNRKIEIKISDLYALLDLVDVYLRIAEVRKARAALDKAQEVLCEGQDIPQHVIAYQTAKGRVETAEGDFAAAVDSLNGVLRLSKKVYDPYQVMAVHYALSEHYLARRQLSKALGWFWKCLSLAEKYSFDGYLVSAGRTSIELFRLTLEQNHMPEFVMKILKRMDTDAARNAMMRVRSTEKNYDFECDYLGCLEIKDAYGRVITPEWRTSRAKMIFIILSAKHPDGCTKEQLVDACWPRKPANQAVRSLQVEMSALRRTLRRFLASQIGSESVILYRAQKYLLNPRLMIKKDFQHFEGLVHEATATESIDLAKSMELYERARAMYHGDFCEDLSLDWIANMRGYYREMMMKVLKKMAGSRYHERKIKDALALYRDAQHFDQYDESIHIGIMRCLAAMKDTDGVQQQYQTLVRTLKELDNLQPSSEAVEIYRASFG
jgi:LuxR family maltose regulon positive regulatory protein